MKSLLFSSTSSKSKSSLFFILFIKEQFFFFNTPKTALSLSKTLFKESINSYELISAQPISLAT